MEVPPLRVWGTLWPPDRRSPEPLKALFEVALDEDPTKRLAFLRERWVNPSLYAAVECLPAEHEQAGAFLSTPAMDDLPR